MRRTVTDGPQHTNSASHVDRIPGVRLDDAGIIHTEFVSYHPVTGEGLPIDAPPSLKRENLVALVRDSEDSGSSQEFDWDRFLAEMGSSQ